MNVLTRYVKETNEANCIRSDMDSRRTDPERVTFSFIANFDERNLHKQELVTNIGSGNSQTINKL